MDFKLENVLVSLHSLKTMGLGPFGASAPLFLRNGELLGHSPIRNVQKASLTIDGNERLGTLRAMFLLQICYYECGDVFIDLW